MTGENKLWWTIRYIEWQPSAVRNRRGKPTTRKNEIWQQTRWQQSAGNRHCRHVHSLMEVKWVNPLWTKWNWWIVVGARAGVPSLLRLTFEFFSLLLHFDKCVCVLSVRIYFRIYVVRTPHDPRTRFTTQSIDLCCMWPVIFCSKYLQIVETVFAYGFVWRVWHIDDKSEKWHKELATFGCCCSLFLYLSMGVSGV